MDIQFKQGSVWRKWDLHVHTPETKLNDRYSPIVEDEDIWKTFCDKLEQSDVQVFGITDYFSADNFFKCLSKFSTYYPDSKKVFLPNIEFRLDDKNKDNDHINLHVIFDTSIQQEDIEKFLGSISLSNVTADGSTKKCNAADLSSIGYDNAIVQRDAIVNALNETFGYKKPFLIVGVANGYGGIRPEAPTGRRAEYAKTIDEISDAFFGRAQDREFFLSERYDGSVPKAVVTGSDCHSFEDLDTQLGKQVIKIDEAGNEVIVRDITWIKADPTLEGLSQIRFEPEDRIKVQVNNPFDDHVKLFFNAINITGRVKFVIPNVSIPLNRELVTIIGGRGSGKSALLESIALLNEVHTVTDGNDKPRLVEHYRRNIDNADPAPDFNIGVELVDKDGNTEIQKKSLSETQSMELPFLYIGQEQLSANATNDTKLTEIVCDLIDIDPGSFQDADLIEIGRTLNASINTAKVEIRNLLEKYEFTETDFTAWMDQKIKQKNLQKNKLTSKETQKLLEEINAITQRGLQLNSLKEELGKLEISFSDLDLNRVITEYNEKLEELYPGKGRTIPLISLKPQLDFVTEQTTQTEIETKELRKQFAEKKLALIKSGLKEDVNVLVQAAQSIEREINTLVTDRKFYAKKSKDLSDLTITRAKLLEKVGEHAEKSSLAISEKFQSFLASRDDSEEVERDLFHRIIQGVSVEGAVVFDQQRFCKYLLHSCLDKRKVKNEEELKRLIAGTTPTGQSKDLNLVSLRAWVLDSLEIFCREYCTNESSEECLTDFLFTQWDEFVRVKAIAKLDGVATEKLSVGQRGTLLLKVNLATSNARPIVVIDQPEDNLDNQFIMNELVPLIRDIKKSRQIIIATHNANLVVNTDAEQVIVADLGKEPPYTLGSIENPDVNKQICDILEGGKTAFEKRQAKYATYSS